jgi:glycolate oxidase FAD binding subunit
MKNVAGYDVSRLAAGSLGTLGLIAEVSLKLAPMPPAETTLALEAPQARALELMNRWAGQPLPVSATAWHDGVLSVRLSGASAAVRAATAQLGGTRSANEYWVALREQRDAFFAGPEPLWRLALPSTAAPLELEGRQLIEWGGALRWLRSSEDALRIRAVAKELSGHATLFRAAHKRAGCFTPLDPVLERLHRALKQAFDPAGIFNPGRLYPAL